MSDEVEVYGLRHESGLWYPVNYDPYFTFCKSEAERMAHPPCLQVDTFTDEEIAKVPEMAAALIAALEIRTARIKYRLAQGAAWRIKHGGHA